MGIYRTLRDNLKTIIEGTGSFSEVTKRPTLKFSGFPAAFIVPSGNENDFQSTNENQRIYAVKVWIFQEYDQTSANTAYEELMDRVDDVIDAIDRQEDPDQASRSMADNLPSKATLMAVMAAPGQFVPDEEEKLLAAQITVKCKVLIDLTQL
jgi:hypothetical protein